MKMDDTHTSRKGNAFMAQSVYELIAVGARYLFAGLMLLIVVRGWRLTIIDGNRAQTLRRLSPETGISGELMVMEGDEQARRGMATR